jgi:hypothetical protein
VGEADRASNLLTCDLVRSIAFSRFAELRGAMGLDHKINMTDITIDFGGSVSLIEVLSRQAYVKNGEPDSSTGLSDASVH